MRSTMLGNVAQVDPEVISGDDQELQVSKLGQLFTADWKTRLLLAGKIWKAHIGAITADNAITKIVGGGNGTVMDMEQPEMILGVSTGYYLMLLEADVLVESDCDAPDDFMEILLFGDRTQAPVFVAGTVTTPVNCLDGAGAFPGVCYTAVTTDMVDPVLSELFMYRRYETTAVVMAGAAANEEDAIETSLTLHYEPQIPSILAGPCSVVLLFDGTVATNGIATLTFAAVPSSWFPVV